MNDPIAPHDPSGRTVDENHDAEPDDETRGRESTSSPPSRAAAEPRLEPTGEPRDDSVGGVPPATEPGAIQPGPRQGVALDRDAVADEAVGDDTIREGRVGGVQGPAHATRGQGQGG